MNQLIFMFSLSQYIYGVNPCYSPYRYSDYINDKEMQISMSLFS